MEVKKWITITTTLIVDVVNVIAVHALAKKYAVYQEYS